jgi:hypothetical protein
MTVNYGKLGTDGQTQVKSFASPEEATKAAEKLVAEKTKKGYVETAANTKEMKVESKKYGLSYDDYDNGKTQEDILKKMLNDKALPDLKQITIGCWDFESGSCQDLVDGIVANKDKFAHIEGLFWGDIEQEESEVSWIEQTDLSSVIDAMPKLKELKIKGTNNLTLGKRTYEALQSLEIISGGLPESVLAELQASTFPKLEKLILWVGVEDYGFDGSVDSFKTIASKTLFPKVKYFGIVNSEFQDDILNMLLQSDILPQLETLDISYGTLGDKGGQALIDNVDKLKHLKLVKAEYNYFSEDMCKALKKLPVKVDVSDNQGDEDDEDDRYPYLTE